MDGRRQWVERGRAGLRRLRPAWDGVRAGLARHKPPKGWWARLGWVADGVRWILLPIALILGIRYFFGIVGGHYPVEKWLFWRYAVYWLGTSVFVLACLGAGARALSLVGATRWPVRDQLLFSFGLGLLVFGLAVFCAGLVGRLTTRFFYVLPAALIAIGGLPLWQLLRRSLRLLRSVGRLRIIRRAGRLPPARDRLLGLAATLIFVVGVFLVYLTIVTPDNVLFDARWYHLGLADQYVRERTIRASPEGWFMAAYPQLATYVYTWGFMLPDAELFDQLALAAHLEFAIFLWTLAGVGVLTRRLVPHAHPRWAFVVMLLFPGLYLYDSSLGMGADHVAAFWGPLVFIGMLRSWREFSVRSWTVTAAAVAGVALTKYTALSMVIFPVMALGGAVLFKLIRMAWTRPRDWTVFRAPAAGVVVGVVLTAPHWLKNWLWYGNPVYPLAAAHFDNRPWSPEAAQRFSELAEANAWVPKGTFAEKVQETLWALWEFSFIPHDWPKLHGKVPVFGSLFTLSMLALPLLKRSGRVWVLAIATHLGIFFWYWTQHEDRYLQALLPWMAAGTAAVFALVWKTHMLARLAVLALVAAQLIWGGDVYVIPAHRMLSKPPVKKTMDLIGQGYQRKYEQRFKVLTRAQGLNGMLPDNARLLLHEHNPRLGTGAIVTTDTPFQAGLIYGTMKNPREIYEHLVGMGVTHVAWRTAKSKGWDSLAGDLLFFDFVGRHVGKTQRKGMWTSGVLVDEPVPPQRPDDVLYLGCQRGYRWGIYPRSTMRVSGRYKTKTTRYPKPREAMKAAERAAELLPEVSYVVHHRRCFKKLPAEVPKEFEKLAERVGGMDLWTRKAAASAE